MLSLLASEVHKFRGNEKCKRVIPDQRHHEGWLQMTLDDLFNKAKQGTDISMLVELVMKDVYMAGTISYAGLLDFRINKQGHASFGGATREEYGKALPSRLAIQVISLATVEVPKPDPAYLAIILPSPPFVPPNETFGPESFVPRVTTASATNGVAFDNTSGTIQVIIHK